MPLISKKGLVMFKWFQNKNRRVISIIIIVILALAMIIPLMISGVSGF